MRGIVLILVFVACGEAHMQSTSKVLSGNIADDVNMLLPAETIAAELMDGIGPNERRDELNIKFQEAFMENYDWYQSYFKTIPEGEPMPYHDSMGMDENEYNELQTLLEDITLVSSGNELIKIHKSDSKISFIVTDQLPLLKTLIFDLNNNTVLLDDYVLDFTDSINITDADNGLRSKWKGYKWEYNGKDNTILDSLKNIDTYNWTNFTVTLGLLESSQNTLLHVKARGIYHGEQTMNLKSRLVFANMMEEIN